MPSTPTAPWCALPQGGATGTDWASPEALDNADPYLAWAETDRVSGYRLGTSNNPEPRWLPIVIELAQSLGVDARPFVVAVMFSASVAFATPVGYQTNMMVYGPGGYRFSDYMRVGIPLNILTGLVASALIPVIWPL